MARDDGMQWEGQGVRFVEGPKLSAGKGKDLEDLCISHLADIALVRSV